MLPPKNGRSRDLSSVSIVLGSPHPDYNKLNIIFGTYVQVYIFTTNSSKHIMVGAIALIPSNERGEYYFMSLATKKQFCAVIWKELPINYQVIPRVNYLATKEKHPKMTKGYPIFEWIPSI